jgi:hypothetical protein
MRTSSRWTVGCLLSLLACSPRGAALDVEVIDAARDAARSEPRPDREDPLDADRTDADREDTASADVETSVPDAGPSDASGPTVDVAFADAVSSEGGPPLGSDGGDPDGSAPFAPPDFTLPDLNPLSGTHRMDVSPRALRGRVTAWYFGTST